MRTPKNLGKHELIGLNVSVSKGMNTLYVGRVVDETMNTFLLEAQGREVRVPKTGHDFDFDLNGVQVRINGDRIRFRPEDRTKKVRKVC